MTKSTFQLEINRSFDIPKFWLSQALEIAHWLPRRPSAFLPKREAYVAVNGEVRGGYICLMPSTLKIIPQRLLRLLDKFNIVARVYNVAFSKGCIFADRKGDVGVEQNSDNEKRPGKEAEEEPYQTKNHHDIGDLLR